MEHINWQELAVGIFTLVSMIGIHFATKKGKKSSDGDPPPERPITLHESKEALKELKGQLHQNGEVLRRDIADMMKALDRIQEAIRYIERKLSEK